MIGYVITMTRMSKYFGFLFMSMICISCLEKFSLHVLYISLYLIILNIKSKNSLNSAALQDLICSIFLYMLDMDL